MLSFFLEILKISVPALIVAGTVYFLLNRFTNSQYALRLLDIQQQNSKTTLPLKLQAYERLSLLCDRISVASLLNRLRTQGSTVGELKLAMLIALQQEWEHNVTQQIYVSENLWNILKVARDNSSELITKAAEGLDTKADSMELARTLFNFLEQNPAADASLTAQMAIRQEVTTIL